MSIPSVTVDTHLLSELLPYDPSIKIHDKLKVAVKEYSLLLKVTTGALEAIGNRNFESFDALVGENACQIRAIKIAILAPHIFLNSASLESAVVEAQRKLHGLSLSIETMAKNKVSLRDLLTREGLDIVLTADELFCIQTYMLSVVKTLKPQRIDVPLLRMESTEINHLKQLGKVSTGFTNNLIKKARQQLSIASVNFVRQQARLLPDASENLKKVSEEFTIEHNGNACVPFFFGNDILMQGALAHRIPIVVQLEQMAQDQEFRIIRQVTFFFTPTDDGKKYREAIPLVEDMERVAFVIKGVMCRKQAELPVTAQLSREFLEHDIVDLILYNSATHRQYPDPSKENLVHHLSDIRFMFYRAEGHRLGCSLENPSLFFINHAFCSSLSYFPSLKKRADQRVAIASLIKLPLSLVEEIMSYLERE